MTKVPDQSHFLKNIWHNFFISFNLQGLVACGAVGVKGESRWGASDPKSVHL